MQKRSKKSVTELIQGMSLSQSTPEIIAELSLEDIKKRELLIERGQYDFRTDLDLAKHYYQKSVDGQKDGERVDPLLYHKDTEHINIVNKDNTEQFTGISDITIVGDKLVFTTADGSKKELELPATKVVEKTVSGNAVNRKPEKILITDNCFHFKMRVAKRPAPHFVFLYDEEGVKCNPQITWTKTELIIDSNVDLKNHVIIIGV